MSARYEAAETVRAMLRRPELTDDAIDEAARRCGWPEVDPHPFLVAEKADDR